MSPVVVVSSCIVSVLVSVDACWHAEAGHEVEEEEDKKEVDEDDEEKAQEEEDDEDDDDEEGRERDGTEEKPTAERLGHDELTAISLCLSSSLSIILALIPPTISSHMTCLWTLLWALSFVLTVTVNDNIFIEEISKISQYRRT